MDKIYRYLMGYLMGWLVFRKTTRAFFVLSILLGGGYLFWLDGPKDSLVYLYMRNFVVTTQVKFI